MVPFCFQTMAENELLQKQEAVSSPYQSSSGVNNPLIRCIYSVESLPDCYRIDSMNAGSQTAPQVPT